MAITPQISNPGALAVVCQYFSIRFTEKESRKQWKKGPEQGATFPPLRIPFSFYIRFSSMAFTSIYYVN